MNKNVISSEFYKLKKSRPFWALLIVSAFFGVFLPLAIQQGVASGEAEMKDIALSGIEILNYAYSMPILPLVAAVFVSIFVSGEFHYGTMKNYISKGLPRADIFIGKYLACAAAVSAMFVAFNVSLLVSGTVLFGFDPHGVFVLSGFVGMLAVAWLLFMAYTAVFEVVAMHLRSNGGAIAVNICTVTVFPTLLGALDFLLRGLGVKPSKLWISAGISGIAKLPLPSGALLTGVILAVVYFIAMHFVGIALFRKTDVK
ncbi:MAG: ABC transporter permease subunit [Pygmaiobacter sp.]|nr:ABC transporter permease subunit [Pygmaiobacter sp.]